MGKGERGLLEERGVPPAWTRKSRIRRLLLRFLFCSIFLLLSLPLPSGAEEKEEGAQNGAGAQIPQNILLQERSEEDGATGVSADLFSPDEIEKNAERQMESFSGWFHSMKDRLFHALLFSVFLVIFIFLMIWGSRSLMKKIRKRENLSFRLRLFSALIEPALVLCGFWMMFAKFFPIIKTLPQKFIPFDLRLFHTGITILFLWGTFRLIEVFGDFMDRLSKRADNNLDCLLVNIIRKSMKTIVLISGILFIGQWIYGINITTILTGAGAIGLAGAYIAKETLTNFLGALVIVADKPFRIGDRIKVNGVDGIVEEVGMRSSRIKTAQESTFCIPNSMLTSAALENISLNGHIRYLLTMTLSYDSSPAQIRRAIQVIHEVVDDFHGPDSERYKPLVNFTEFGDWSINIEVLLWLKTDSFKVEDILKNEINLLLLEKLNQAGIQMAFPSTTNYLVFAGKGAPPPLPSVSPSASGVPDASAGDASGRIASNS